MAYIPDHLAAEPTTTGANPTDTVVVIIGGAQMQMALTTLFGLQAGASTSLTPTAIAANRIFQRDTRTGNPTGFTTTFGKGWGAVSFVVSLNQAVANGVLELQLRDASNPGTPQVPGPGLVQPWTTIASGNLPAGANTVAVNVPASGKLYLADFRVNGWDGNITTASGMFGVGEVVAYAGQSLAVNLVNDVTGAEQSGTPIGTLVPGSVGDLGPVYFGGAWTVPTDKTINPSAQVVGVFSAELPRLILLGAGVVSAMAGWAQTGVSITTFAPGTGPNFLTGAASNWVQLYNNLHNMGGKFGSFYWLQGNNDALDGMPAATYQADLTALISALQTTFPSTTLNASGTAQSFTRPICTICSTQSAYPPGFTEAIRGAAQAYCATDPLAQYVACLDVTLQDGTHQDPPGLLMMAREVYRALMESWGLMTHVHGPSITGATRASGSQVIKLAVQQDGGSNLEIWKNTAATHAAPTYVAGAGTDAATQFQVFASPTVFNAGTLASSPLALSSTTPLTIVSGTEIDLELAALPPGGDGTALDVWYRLPLDSTAAIKVSITDDRTSAQDGDGTGLTLGRQIYLSPTAITAPAPVPSTNPTLAISSVAPVVAGSSSTASGTFTNGAPTSLTATLDGSALTISSIVITPTSGSGSTAAGTFTFAFTTPAAGSHSLVATGTGTFVATSPAFSFTATSASAPMLTITGTAPLTGGATATASGTFSNGAPASLTATLNGNALTIAAIAITPTSGSGSTAAGTFSFTFTNPAASPNTLVATGTGTFAATSNSFQFTTTSASSPTLTITGVSPLTAGSTGTVSGTFTNGAPTGLTATVDGNAATIAGVSINTTSGSGATASGNFSFTLTNPAAGSHTVVATGSGTFASVSNSFPFTTTAAASPTLTITGVSPLTVGATATASGSFANGAPTGLTAVLDGSSVSIAGVTITPTSGSGSTAAGMVSFTFTNPSAGTHSLTATGTGTFAATSPAFSFTTSTATPNVPPLSSMSASALGAWGMRQLTSSYTGPAIRVQRASDSTQTDIGFDSGGNLDTATLLTFVAGGSGDIAKWYDQSGNGHDLTPFTTSILVPIVSSGTLNTINGRGAALTSSGGVCMPQASAAMSLSGATMTGNVVAFGVGSVGRVLSFAAAGGTDTGTNGLIFAFGTGSHQVAGRNQAGNLSAATLSTSGQAAILTSLCDGTDHTMFLNGTGATPVAQGSQSTGPTGYVGVGVGGNGASSNWVGSIAEAFVFGTALSTADRQVLEHNQESYFGITGV